MPNALFNGVELPTLNSVDKDVSLSVGGTPVNFTYAYIFINNDTYHLYYFNRVLKMSGGYLSNYKATYKRFICDESAGKWIYQKSGVSNGTNSFSIGSYELIWCNRDVAIAPVSSGQPDLGVYMAGSEPEYLGEYDDDTEFLIERCTLEDIACSIRSKMKYSRAFTPLGMKDAINDIDIRSSLNVYYGDTPPGTVDGYWVKSDVPNHVRIYRNLTYTKPIDKKYYANTSAYNQSTGITIDGRTIYNVTPSGAIQEIDIETGIVNNVASPYSTTYTERVLPVRIGDLIYWCGGVFGKKTLTTTTWTTSNSIYVLDMKNDTVIKSNVTLPVDVNISTTTWTTCGNKIYFHGGSKSGTVTYYDHWFGSDREKFTNGIYVYDTETDNVTAVDYLPPHDGYDIYGSGIAVVGSKVFLFGGRIISDNSHVGYTDIIRVYDMDTQSMVYMNARLPVTIGYQKTVVIGDNIYLYGGYRTKSRALTCEVYVYNMSNDKIVRLPIFTTISDTGYITDINTIGTTTYITLFYDDHDSRVITYDFVCAESDVTLGISDTTLLPEPFESSCGKIDMGITSAQKHSGCGKTIPIPVLIHLDSDWIEICRILNTHVETIIPAINPTCTNSGFTSGTKCALCDTILTAPEEIPALEHSYDDGVEVDGVVTYTCTVCGATKQ